MLPWAPRGIGNRGTSHCHLAARHPSGSDPHCPLQYSDRRTSPRYVFFLQRFWIPIFLILILRRSTLGPLVNVPRGDWGDQSEPIVSVRPTFQLPTSAAAKSTAIRLGPATGAGPLGESVANTFRGGSYTQSVLGEELTLYRSYGGTAGQLSPAAGPRTRSCATPNAWPT